MAALLLGFAGSELKGALDEGGNALIRVLPLQLCDLSILLAAAALLTLHRPTTEVLYFWALSGTVLAMLTPDVYRGFPSREFVVFFGLHALVIVSTVTLVFGFGVTPRPGAARRVFAITAAYALVVYGLNHVLGTNFLYLVAKPTNPTLLDYFGPWPIYILVAGAVGFVLFTALGLPFERKRPQRSR